MSLKRIAIFAAVSVCAALPLPLFAQSLASMMTTVTAASLDPLADLLPAASNMQNVSVLLARTTATEGGTDFGARRGAGVSEQVLYKMPRMRLADLAMNLRNIRYRRAGHDPSTGFDCSGFVHYVYNRTFGLDLPYDAPGQYRIADKVSRRSDADWRSGLFSGRQAHHPRRHLSR